MLSRSSASLLKSPAMRMVASRTAVRTKVTLPELDWDFGALEPHISGQINELHYSKHHQTYVNGFNTAVEQIQDYSAQLAREPSPKLARDILQVEQNLKFHGGGYTNHCLFWKSLLPESQGGGHLDEGSALAKAITEQYGSVDALKASTNAALAGVQGSGWAWVVKNLDNGGKLEVVKTMNQDTVTGKKIPLLAIDAWEHAYYLQYQNKKVDYFKAIWNVINWKEAARRYDTNSA